MEYSLNNENQQTVNRYFFCKIEKIEIKLIGLKDELAFDNKEDFKDLIFENNKIYLKIQLIKVIFYLS